MSTTAATHDDDCSTQERYEVFMRGAGMSARWVRDSLSTLRHLERFAGTPIDDVTTLDVQRYLGRDGLAQRSRYTYHGFLLAFFRWFDDNGGSNVMAKMRRPRLPRSEPRPVTDDQLRRVLESDLQPRVRVMILLAALAGLRVHEIAKIRGEDLDDAKLRVIGKGGHSATLPLHPLVVEATAAMPATGWWFPSPTNTGPITGRAVCQLIARTMRRAGVNATAHRLRHWYGTNLVSSGADLRTTQTLLRHASLQTTQMYTAVSDDRRGAAVARLDPTGTGQPPAPADESPRSPTPTAVRKTRHRRAADDTPRLVLKPDTPTAKTPKLILEVGTTNCRPTAVTIAELERAPKLTCEAPDHAGTARPAYAVTWRSASLCCAETVTLGTQLMCAQCRASATADGWSCQRCDSHDLPASTWVESTRQL